MDRAMLALLFSLAFFLFQGANSTTFTFQNNCRDTVWPATLNNYNSSPLSNTGFELPSNAAPVSVYAPPGWSGILWARKRCSRDPSGRFSCQSGNCGSGQIACINTGPANPITLVEFTVQSNGKDTYDISLVNGFNMRVLVAPQGRPDCPSTGCTAHINEACPSQLAAKATDGFVIGCKSACDAFNTDAYCCRGAYSIPGACKPSEYSMRFKSQCPKAYSYAQDDRSSTFNCVGVGANYRITFCPP